MAAVILYRVCTHFWTEIWRRCRLEFRLEWPMLLKRWKPLLGCVVFQYVHGIFAQLAHRLHKPLSKPLDDVGFRLLPELGEKRKMVSEIMFVFLAVLFVIWSFSPFVTSKKRFYTVVLYTRILLVLVTCQALRILAFSVTRLPAPNYHCRLGKATAMRAWPKRFHEHLIFDPRRAMMYSCGDLIFSSHTTFCLCGALAYHEYGSFPVIKVMAWVAVALVSLAIIASRKHYTVDVLVAWWTVPLIFYTLHRRWTTSRPVDEERDEDAAMMIPMTMHQSPGLPPPHRQPGLRGSRVSSMADMAGPSGGGVLSPPGGKAIGSMSAQELSELTDVDVDQSRP